MLNAIKNALKGKSWTVNFNVAMVVGVLVDVLLGLDIVKNNPDYAMLLTALGNILLRFKTKEPVSKKG